MLGSWTEYAGLWTNFLGIIWDIQNFLKICKSWVWVYALNNARYCISFSIYFCDITLYSYITPVFSRKKCLFINMLSEIHCKKIMNRKEPATKRIRKRAGHKAYTERYKGDIGGMNPWKTYYVGCLKAPSRSYLEPY